MSKKLEFERVLAGVEDLLLDANLPDAISQNRLVGTVLTGVTVHKVNLRTIPYSGKFGDGNFVSIGDKLDEIASSKDKYIAETASGGIGIVSGASDVTWDGGALGSNQVGLVQKLGNGHVRWLGYADIGSDTWHWRGTVRGVAGAVGNEFVIKSQLDALAALANTQSDWNQSNTSNPAYIKNKPTITTYSQATTSTAGIVEKATDAEANAGTDDTRYITPKQLKAIADANASASSGSSLSGKMTIVYLGCESSENLGTRGFVKFNTNDDRFFAAPHYHSNGNEAYAACFIHQSGTIKVAQSRTGALSSAGNVDSEPHRIHSVRVNGTIVMSNDGSAQAGSDLITVSSGDIMELRTVTSYETNADDDDDKYNTIKVQYQ